MKRRNFIGVLGALPFIGKIFAEDLDDHKWPSHWLEDLKNKSAPTINGSTIEEVQEYVRFSDRLLGKPIPGRWTPIGQMRDPDTADDPVLARKLMKEMLDKAKRESDAKR